MSNGNEPAPLTAEQLARVRDAADRYGRRRAAGAVDPSAYLPPEGDPLRAVVLCEILRIDLEHAWRGGAKPQVEEYFRTFPELRGNGPIVTELLYEEYRIRQLFGDRPALHSYRPRFPQYFEALEGLLEDQGTRMNVGTALGAGLAPSDRFGTMVSPSLPSVAPQAPVSAAPSPAAEPLPVASLGAAPLAVASMAGASAVAPPSFAPPSFAAAPSAPAAVPAPSAPQSQGPPQILSDGTRLLDRLGRGSFAEVWRALAPGDVPVAIKLIIRPVTDDEAQRELQSLELIKQLRHPFLIATQRFWTEGERLYIATELADGTLRDRLKECRKRGVAGIPVDELLRYIDESAQALDYLRDQKLLHRDIKPENILILQRHAKVGDFGLARVFQGNLMTATGSGTPRYMPPEAWRGKVSDNTDQYSLALCYVELRLDRWPFMGQDMMAVMVDHMENAPDLSGLAEEERAVVARGLAKKPEERYPSCTEFSHALIEAVAKTAPEAQRLLRRPGRPTDQVPGFNTATGQQVFSADNQSVYVSNRPSQTTVGEPTTSTAGPVAPARKSHLPMALAGVLALCLAGAAAGWWFLGGAAELKAPPALKLRAGAGAQALTVHVERGRFSGPIEVACPEPPPGIRVKSATIPPGQTSVDLEVSALPESASATGPQALRITASFGDQSLEASTETTVDGLAYTLPEGWRKAEGAMVAEVRGRHYYDRIDVVRGGVPVRFLLVARGRHEDEPRSPQLPTYYIMEDKVWLSLFRKYAEERAGQLLNRDWELMGKKANSVVNKHDDHPVMGVVVGDAHRFALWIGGRLPSMQQWDKAFGLYDKDRAASQFLKAKLPNEIGIGRMQGTLARNAATNKDVSILGVRDMAGNGKEWTRDVEDPSKAGFLDKLDDKDQVFLRGASYTDETPLRYEDLQADRRSARVPHPGMEPTDYVSFRVVLETE